MSTAPLNISLRELITADLDAFFAHQLNTAAQQMAAFISNEPANRERFDAHWEKITADPTITIRTIIAPPSNLALGHIVCHSFFGDPEISYWIDANYWGRGVATQAVNQFLKVITIRPLLARVAKDNIPSRRVLEKNEFKITAEDRGFANARNAEIEEYILTLI